MDGRIFRASKCSAPSPCVPSTYSSTSRSRRYGAISSSGGREPPPEVNMLHNTNRGGGGGRREAARVVQHAQQHQPRAGRDGIVELLPRGFDELHPGAREMRRVEVVRELALERHDAVAFAPVDPVQQQPQAGLCIADEGDGLRLAVDQPSHTFAKPVHVVKPVEEIRACQVIAIEQVFQHRLVRAARHLPIRRRIQIRPVPERRKLGANLDPIDAHWDFKNATTPFTGTSVARFVRRSTTSTNPCASFLPLFERYGIPTRSASLNFTPGRSSRSSSSTSSPLSR